MRDFQLLGNPRHQVSEGIRGENVTYEPCPINLKKQDKSFVETKLEEDSLTQLINLFIFTLEYQEVSC